MKRLFQRKKKSASDAGSLASSRSASGYNVSPKKELPKLHKAAFENDIAKLKLHLKKGDVNQLDKQNRTALHLACAEGNAESVRILVAHPHCNLNLCDNDRRSALMKCVQCQFQNCLEILVQKRADVNLSDINGNTALHLAAAIPSVDVTCLLLDSNADVNQKNKEGSAPLHIAASTENSEGIVKNLVEDGAHVNAVDNSGKSPLMLAASRGHLDIVKLLLSCDADANLKDSRGWSADDYASMNGHHPISMIIFESSQKQEKKGQSRPPSGEHVYATVNKSGSGSPFVGSSGRKDDGLSSSDDSSRSLSLSSEHDPMPDREETKAPVVNVAAFMKQRQMKKANPDADGDEAREPSVSTSPKMLPELEESKPATVKEPETRSGLRFHGGYHTSSGKGGPVSPRKPPLPIPRSALNTSSNEVVQGEVLDDADDDSPWDDDEEEELDDVGPASSSNQFFKPDANVMKDLGFTSEDIQNIYIKSSDENSSRHENKVTSMNENNNLGDRQTRKRLDDSDSDETVSSAWDEDATEKSESKVASVNFLASSSLLKFDDELSDHAPAVSSSNVKTNIPPPISEENLRDQGVLSDDESSFDSTKIGKEVEPARQSTAPKQIVEDVGHDSDSEDESSEEISTESESEWEIENRQRREVAKTEELSRDGSPASSDEDAVPVKTKMATQKTLAMEAAAAVKVKKKRREEEEKRQEEEHVQLLASQDREKIEAALQEALAGSGDPTESDVSEIDDRYMGNISANKMGDSRGLSIPTLRMKSKNRDESKISSHMNGLDPATWTGTETESELDEDLVGVIPSSLHSSGLADALLRSGERGELEREAAREKRRAIDAIEQLEFARRDKEALQEQIAAFKVTEHEMSQSINEKEATIRKLTFEQNRLKGQLDSSGVEVTTSKEKIKRFEEHLEIESATRRKHEVTIRELRNELKIAEQQLKELEADNQELKQKVQQISLHEQVSSEKAKVDREIEGERKQALQVEALNLLLQEREKELIEVRAERKALDERCERYKDELNIFHSKGGDDKMIKLRKFNEELNDKVEELSRNLEEKEQLSYHTSREFALQLELIEQANQMLTDQLKKKQSEKDVALQDLEALNSQQQMLKRKIEEVEEQLHKAENKGASMEGEMKGLREQKEAAERRLHNFEMNESTSLQESSNLRASLSNKESLLVQAQKENMDFREKLKNYESEINELRRESARQHGRIEMLQADVSQQESERIRLRRELEDARNMSNSTLTTQQGRLSEIMSANQTERIELEKVNAQLKQQLAHLREEIGKINEEKLKKDEELARAQQDRIETHKHLSFTESSMAQLTESQQMLQQDKHKMALELETSKNRCNSLENRVEETHRQMASLRDELTSERQTSSIARRDIQSLEMEKTNDRDRIMRLENHVKEVEMEKQKLESELSSYTNREKDAVEDKELLMRSRTQLEELVAKLQDEKVAAEEKMKSEMQRCEILHNEASGHRRMWEEEVKARSKLSVELARVDQERRDARNTLDAYREKLSKASLQGKAYRTKYENQKRQKSKLERQIDEYSRLAAESRVRCDTSESECESRLSRMSEDHESERSRLEATIHELQSRVLGLEQSLRTAKDEKNTADRNRGVRITDSSVAELEQERNQLREELKRARSKTPDEARVRAIANAQVNATLDQVNTWLEEKAVAQDVLERLRFDNEEKRVAEANKRADDLQRELDVLRSRMQRPQQNEEKRKLQQVTRENIDLQDKLHRTKQDLEETRIKLDHERKKYKQLHTSALTGAVSGNLMGIPQHPLLTTSLANKSSVDIATSTPRRSVDPPTLAQLRHQLDTSIAMRLASSQSGDDMGRSSRREEPAHKEYFIP